jgi:hypothetical protein
MTNDADADPRFELAYEEAKRAVDFQQGSLRDLRSRAGNLIAIAAAVTSFAAGVGLIQTDPSKPEVFPTWAAYVLLALLVAIGALALAVLWPTEWNFTLNAPKIIEKYIDATPSLSLKDLHKELAIYLQGAYTKNHKKLEGRATAYRVGAALLILEVAILVFALR